jgi:OMPG-porin 1 family
MRSFLAFIGLCLILPGSSQGAEWTLKGSLDQSLGYDSNVRMQPDPQGSFKYMIVPVLTFLRKTDITEIQADATYGTQVYTEIPQFNQDIQHYGLRGLYKAEKLDWAVESSYSITPSRNNAVQDSGNFNSNATSDTWSVSPSVSYKIDELNSLILSPSYSETSFTNASASDNFRNRSNTNVNLAWQRLWTERYSSTVSFFYSNFKSQQISSTVQSDFAFDSVGINLSNFYSLSENWKLDGTIGGRHTESESNGTSGSSIGFLANATLTYTAESYSSSIFFNRSLSPSSQGNLQELTGVGLNFDYKIADNLTANFNTSYQQSTQINSTNQGDNQKARKNISIQPSINWQLSPDWTFSGSYRYRSQNRSVSGDVNSPNTADADSNLFMLSINYNWQGLSISR